MIDRRTLVGTTIATLPIGAYFFQAAGTPAASTPAAETTPSGAEGTQAHEIYLPADSPNYTNLVHRVFYLGETTHPSSLGYRQTPAEVDAWVYNTANLNDARRFAEDIAVAVTLYYQQFGDGQADKLYDQSTADAANMHPVTVAVGGIETEAWTSSFTRTYDDGAQAVFHSAIVALHIGETLAIYHLYAQNEGAVEMARKVAERVARRAFPDPAAMGPLPVDQLTLLLPEEAELPRGMVYSHDEVRPA